MEELRVEDIEVNGYELPGTSDRDAEVVKYGFLRYTGIQAEAPSHREPVCKQAGVVEGRPGSKGEEYEI